MTTRADGAIFHLCYVPEAGVRETCALQIGSLVRRVLSAYSCSEHQTNQATMAKHTMAALFITKDMIHTTSITLIAPHSRVLTTVCSQIITEQS